MYDIIGDIHGNDEKLVTLLQKLGYHQDHNAFFHPHRKIIFLGDFIDKGKNSRKVLALVRGMVEQGHAYAVVGNHEWFLIGYFTKNKQGQYLRSHTEEHRQQLSPTLDNFFGDLPALLDYVDWLKTLPLFLSLEGIRAVHAYWHAPSVNLLRKHYGNACRIGELIPHLRPGSDELSAINELVEGIKLPEPLKQRSFKAKWWNLAYSNRYQDLAIRPDPELDQAKVAVTVDVEEYTYPDEAPPLFFGHYNLPGQPVSIGRNYCCLDYSLPDQTIIPAYRWEGETDINPEHIIY